VVRVVDEYEEPALCSNRAEYVIERGQNRLSHRIVTEAGLSWRVTRSLHKLREQLESSRVAARCPGQSDE
jgi:hypothetical protein